MEGMAVTSSKSKKANAGLFILLALLSALPPTTAFTPVQPQLQPTRTSLPSSSKLHVIPPIDITDLATTSSTFLQSAVPVFDGSSVVDPVVVSNAFWDGLTRQFVSLIIGQFLAVTVFGVFTTFFGSQISRLGSFVAETVFRQPTAKGLKQPPPGYTGGLRVEPDLFKLLLCITIDIIGTSSELIPFVGELTDVAWAPIAALLLRSIFGGSNVIFALEFAEEFLPFTDILPLATICWVVDTFFPESDAAKLLQLGIYSAKQQDIYAADQAQSDRQRSGNVRGDSSVIDVDVEPVRSQLPPEKKL